MVEVNYVDGTEEVFETSNRNAPWKYKTDEQAYLIQSIEGDVIIPAGFVKRLRHIEVDND